MPARRSVTVVACERRTAREHLVQDAAEGPDIRALVDDLAAGLLRAHIGGRAEDDARAASSPAA